jgi:hypothetical protein
MGVSEVTAGRTHGTCDGGAQTPYTVTTSPAFTLWHHIDYPLTTLPPNGGAITVQFSKPVYRAVIGVGSPFIAKCGSEGAVVFGGAGGSVSLPLHPVFAAEQQCYEHSEAWFQSLMTDTAFSVAGFTTVTISPPSPINWDWLCLDSSWCVPLQAPVTVQVHGFVAYGVQWQDQLVLGPVATSCIINDPILDLVAMRQLMDSLWRLSGGDGPPAQRIERGGYLMVDADGFVSFKISEIATGDDACGTANSQPFPPSGVTLIASVHIHPFRDKESIAVCYAGASGYLYNGKKNFGFSYKKLADGTELGDLPRLAHEAASLPAGYKGAYLVDKTQISFAPVGATVKNIKTKGSSKSRVQPSGCRIV